MEPVGVETHGVRMSFDRLARHYRWMEAALAGKTLQRARTAWLGELQASRRALLVGEGNGRFLSAALVALPETQFLCVDASAAMLALCRRAVPRRDVPRVEYLCRTLPDWVPARGEFDLVVTHFFLDCFPAPILDRVVACLADSATPQAAWLLADFVLPAQGPARWRARVVHALMYGFFRRATRIPARRLVPPESRLQTRGFVCTHRQEFEWRLIRSTLWRRG